MKKIFVLFITCWVSGQALAQECKCDSVYQIVDQMPMYKSGNTELMDEIKRIRFEKDCKPEDLRQLTITINKEGKLIDAEVKGLTDFCKDKIVKQVKQFTDWKPGKSNGVPVCVKLTFPIHIRVTK
jgi:hypothetical protein